MSDLDVSSGLKAANIAVLVILLGYYALSTVYLIRYRDVASFQQRSLTLSLVFSIAAALLTIAYLLRPLLYSAELCIFPLWYNYLLIPIGLIALFGRLLRVAANYSAREAALRQVEAFAVADNEMTENDATSKTSRTLTVPNAEESTERAAVAPFLMEDANSSALNVASVYSGGIEHKENAKPKLSHIEAARASGILRYIIFLVVYTLCAIIYLVIQTNADHCTVDDGLHGVPEAHTVYWPLNVFVVLLIIIMPATTLYNLRGIADKYAIRREAIYHACIWILFYGVFLVLTHVVYTEQVIEFPTVYVILLAFLVSHAIGIAWPLVRVYLHGRRRRALVAGKGKGLEAGLHKGADGNPAGSREAFRQLLNDPVQFREFKAFTIRNLSIENSFFYDTCRSLLEAAEVHARVSAEGRPDPQYELRLARRLQWIRDTFLRTNGELEVNLSHGTRRRLDRACRDLYLDEKAVRAAMDEVEALMFYDTYQRYLQAKANSTANSIAE